ncbi:MAG: hypothetical protein IT336_05555 [Thermomicrobiales bacterium]|nr:hypothetical protein [Thermomicrobiales bacterium]
MSGTIEAAAGIARQAAGIPDAPVCAACGVGLQEPFGWCSNCRDALCQGCRDAHYCTEGCREAGCFAGLCVRTVEHGMLSIRWRIPPARGERR